jgi:hypothetical protein
MICTVFASNACQVKETGISYSKFEDHSYRH